MALTSVTVTHTFENPDGTPASGSVTFALTKRMTNGTQTVVPGEVTAPLDASGHLSAALWANNDTGTSPGDAQYACTFRIATSGAPCTDGPFFITVPSGLGSSVDLGTLLPQDGIGG